MVAEYRFPYDWIDEMIRTALHVSDRLRDITFKRDYQFLELFNAVLSFTWGIWCLLMRPLETFSLVFVSFNRVAPVWFWTIAFITIGAAMFYGLVWERNALRKYSALVACIWWLNISIMFALSHLALFVLPVAVLICLASGVIYMRLVKENANGG